MTAGKWEKEGGGWQLLDLIEGLEDAIELEQILPEDLLDDNKSYRLKLTLEWEEE